MDTRQKNLPLFQSHKRVLALKILTIVYDTDGSATLNPAQKGFEPFRVDAAYLKKHKPQPRGYWVKYTDGYESFSPADAFESGYTLLERTKKDVDIIGVLVEKSLGKSLGNTDSNSATKNVKDIVFWGNGDTFKLISKASSKAEKWMKSTKAMEIEGLGCIVQVTTQQGNNVAEALTFIPSVKIIEEKNAEGKIISRKLGMI